MNYKSISIRDDLDQAIERAWDRLSRAGTWWSGANRLAIVAETRKAVSCELCQARKNALSPYAVKGAHDSLGNLPEVVIDVIHRVRTDAGRLTEHWFQQVMDAGLSDAEYVEIVGIVATTTALDTFNIAISAPLRPLPDPQPGEPSRKRPKGAKRSIAWLPTVAPEDLSDEDIDPYTEFGSLNIQRALSLVPAEVIGFFDLDIALYLPQDAIRDFANEYRALTHGQLEWVAYKASSLNGCFY